MVESGLIAAGSVRGLIGGTHFNRCKRIHPIAALSLRILHFERFLEEYCTYSHETKLDLNEIIDILDRDTKRPDATEITLFELKDILEQYEAYTKRTMNGEHGFTAKYVMSYVRFVEFYQLFERAIRTSDLDLYIYSAQSMCALFFISNHHNYSRWLTRNLDELININKTHPTLRAEFEEGALSVRRTPKNFCRSPIDLTLEQTINANSANKLTGIAAFTNSLSARQRWSETHTVRMAIITELMEFLGLNKSTEGTETEYRSKLFKKQVKLFLEEVKKNMDPFSDDLNPSKLFNLSSGKAASAETTEFLLNFEQNGIKQMKMFINECKVDSKRFDRPLKKNVLRNFSTELYKNKNSTIKIDQTKAERNILGQVLCLAMKQEIDLLTLFSYPLTTVPHSLAHFDGSMISSPKGELTTILMSKNESLQSDCSINSDVDIVDGFYLLSTFRDSPARYGNFAKFVFENICKTNAQEVHILFDRKERPSPRDVELNKRKELFDNGPLNFTIRGPHQERGQSLAKCLMSNSFREELVQFLIRSWSTDDINNILNGKRVFLSFGSKCYLYSDKHEKGKEVSGLSNDHIDLSSKMILHMNKVFEKNIRVRTANPDSVLVHLLYHMQYWSQDREIVIESGDANKNTTQRINVRKIFKTMTPVMINALPSWYAFTGSMYEPSFYGKGKKTSMKLLEKNVRAQNVFASIGNGSTLKDEDITVLEEYTCSLYGQKTSDVNKARLQIFQKGYENVTDLSKKGSIRILKIFVMYHNA